MLEFAVEAAPVNVLLVDDDPDGLTAVQAVLSGLGQNLVMARSGRDALRHLLTTDFAVVLLDVQMEELDGFELADLIRQREKTRHTPIIFLTGAESEAQVVRGYSIGAVDYLLKPIVPEILKSKVAVFVELAHRMQVIERQAELLRESQRATLEFAEIRARLLRDLEASMTLAGSLDFATTVGRVADLTVPRLADWCVIDLVDDHSKVTRVASKHWDPAQDDTLQRLRAAAVVDLASGHPLAVAIRTGDPQLVRDVAAAPAEAGVNGSEAELLRAIGTKSLIAMPLVARGRTLGALLLARAPDSEYGDADLPLAEEFAGRAAIAIDNARLYRLAQEAIAIRDNFLNIASHELRTPLTSMRLQVEALLRELRKAPLTSEEAAVTKVEMVQRQTGRLQRLIDELLDASRIASGRFNFKLESVDLAALARELCRRAPEELASGDVQISVVAPQPVVGRWDRLQVEEVATNLLANALKYGGGKPIEIRVEGTPRLARLVVHDHGIGIAPGDRERIFERFERAASEEHYGGFGLGLWIARQIVEAMEGRITVQSELGVGSTFSVELPRNAARRGVHAELATGVAQSRSRTTA